MADSEEPPHDRRFNQYYGFLFAGFLLLMLVITAAIIASLAT
jgi:hypothetical protein